jgi:hypothetical protein
MTYGEQQFEPLQVSSQELGRKGGRGAKLHKLKSKDCRILYQDPVPQD